MKLLVVDDDEFMPLIRAVWLANTDGFDLQFARDGDEALHRVAECGPFDLVLTDYYHSGPNGLDLAKALRQRHPKQSIAMLMGGVPDSVIRSCRPSNTDRLENVRPRGTGSSTQGSHPEKAQQTFWEAQESKRARRWPLTGDECNTPFYAVNCTDCDGELLDRFGRGGGRHLSVPFSPNWQT